MSTHPLTLLPTPTARDLSGLISPTFHTLIVQPTTLCNLDCAYCYLPDRKRQALMSPLVAEVCAASIHDQASAYPVDVVWHGGEPTATPIAHLRALLAPFETLRAEGRVRHGIQTNATLINEAWCELFAEHDFEVGVSVDGPAWANRDRLDWAGKESFDRTLHGVASLMEAGIDFTVICVVTPATIDRVDELASFFTDIGCASVGFNIEEQEGADRPAIDEHAAYRFWRHLLDRREAGSPLRVRELDRFADHIAAARAGTVRRMPFDPIPTVAHDGDTVLLSPELLGIKDAVYGDFLAGNVLRTPLARMIADAGRLRYVAEFVDALRTCASTCAYFSFCGGAQAGNRYFEHGTFAVAETAYCRNTRQSLVRAAADHLTERNAT
ncbi:MAG: cyclophane-forming radical SAM peptide maturase AmcB [Micromonosporaceae bacterium]